MVNFGPMDSVPPKFAGRNLYKHNPMITLMRTTVDENQAIGQKIAEKLKDTTGPTVVMLPLKGVSMIDAEGEPFDGPEEDAALFDAIRNGLDRDKVTLREMDYHINDAEFATAAAQQLIDLMENK